MKNYAVLILRGDEAQCAVAVSYAQSMPVTGVLEDGDTVSLYFEGATDLDRVREELQGVPGLSGVEYEQGAVAEQNWNAEFEASLQPVAITESVIVAQSWNRDEVEESDAIVVTIDPKMSFGTGHHETTRLVTRLMDNVGVQGRRVLDAGTGTGILSIIAVKKGASGAVAFDNNEWAEENARENIEQNGVAESVEVILGEMDDVAEGAFDLILANMQTGIIIPLLDEFSRRLSGPEARLITSGVLIEDIEDLLPAARQAGLLPVDEDRENEWLGTTFARVEQEG